MDHPVEWYSPAPFWSKRLENGTSDRLRNPALLKFENDDFMGELENLLKENPGTLAEKQAGGDEFDDSPPSFFQPVHECYYLVTASLVCRKPGFPDRAVDTTKKDSVSFVLRRYETIEKEDKTIPVEYGWTGAEWKRVEDREKVEDEEEQLSMFPKTYTPGTPEERRRGITPVERMKGDRRLWVGLLPVAKRETFETAPVLPESTLGAEKNETEEGNGKNNSDSTSEDSSNGLPVTDKNKDKLSDPRKTKFQKRVISAFSQLKKKLEKDKSKDEPSLSAEDIRGPLFFAWLDLWEFLETHLSPVAEKVKTPDHVNLDDEEKELWDLLDTINVTGMGLEESYQEPTATDVLKKIDEYGASDAPGPFPAEFVTDLSYEFDREGLVDAIGQVLAVDDEGADQKDDQPLLKKKVDAALGTPPPAKELSELDDDLVPPTTENVGAGRYVVRCVYERPQCPPSHRRTVGPPSRSFRLASFFDTGAPARDINITLPSASLKDLRETDQSVSMVFTKELRRQAERLQNLTVENLQDGDIGDAPNVNLGMVCSLSIPIITICAMALLLVMVVVLNIVFWWLPFFKICFPLPSGDSG